MQLVNQHTLFMSYYLIQWRPFAAKATSNFVKDISYSGVLKTGRLLRYLKNT
jgi:hypothetical protein